MKLRVPILYLLLWAPSAWCQPTLIPAGSVWKFHAVGLNLGEEWRLESFDDSSWSSGRAQLGWGEGDEQTPVFSRPADDEAPLTTYYRKQFQVTNYVYTLTLRLLRDDGAVVYLNGQEIARDNMPAGEINHYTAAASAIQTNEERWIQFGVFADLLLPGENTLAVEIHQASGQSGWNDSSFDLELIANIPQARPTVSIATPGNGAPGMKGEIKP